MSLQPMSKWCYKGMVGCSTALWLGVLTACYAAERAVSETVAAETAETAESPKVNVHDLCKRVARKLASVSFEDCANASFEHNELRSVEGNPILFKEYPAVDGRKPQARILLLGGIHGDEYTSVSMVFQWVRKLNEYHSGLFEWRVVPLLNPDGLLKPQSQRTNANGVDLNRNFPTPNWDELSQRHWVKDTGRNPRRFPGTMPVSEPESKWLVEAIAHYKPDAIVSLHAPYGVLDFDGPRTMPPQRLGDLRLQLLGTYPGSLGNYAGVNNGIPVVTIELPNAGTMPKSDQVSRLWMDLIGWLKNNVAAPETTQQVTAADQAGPS